ncbi:MAG: hypothetical protein ACMZI2_01760 [Candidatus Symbiodolus clandestinus]
MNACSYFKNFSPKILGYRRVIFLPVDYLAVDYFTSPHAEDVIDCIQKSSIPTEIKDFYNSVIAPNITGTNNGSTLPSIGLNAVNGSFEGLPQVEGPPQSNGTIAYCVGGGVGLGCLIASMAAIAWKRKTLNEKRRKRYQEMVTSNGGQLVKSSENNSLIPQSAIV